jgi:hypothetical protein
MKISHAVGRDPKTHRSPQHKDSHNGSRQEHRKTTRQRVCRECGVQFETSRSHAFGYYCDKCCALIHFVGFDGEGEDCECGTQHYNLLTIGSESIEVSGCQSLGWEEIFCFAYTQYSKAKDWSTAFVGFSLGYDFNKILSHESGFPESKARLLLTQDGQKSRARKGEKKFRRNLWPARVQGQGQDWRPPVALESNGIRITNDLSEDELGQITEEIQWGSQPDVWELQFIGNRLTLRPKLCICPDEEHLSRKVLDRLGQKCQQDQTPYMHICDIFDYFQTSFQSVIAKESWEDGPIATGEEYGIIEVGKDHRSGKVWKVSGIEWFDKLGDADKQRTYNKLECELLSRVMWRLNSEGIFGALGVKLGASRWFGPGQATQAWMALHNVPRRVHIEGCPPDCSLEKHRHLDSSIPPDKHYEPLVPPDFRVASRMSYFGGWFEILVHGIIHGVSTDYDLNNAYTDSIRKLPCLQCATISYVGQPLRHDKKIRMPVPKAPEPIEYDTLEDITPLKPNTTHHFTGHWIPAGDEEISVPALTPGQLCLVYADVEGSDPFMGPMQHRESSVDMLRPLATRGWLWQHEIDASREAGLVDAEQVYGYFLLNPGPPCDHMSWADELAELYDRRLKVGKYTARGRAYKVVCHSAYGKFCETIGETPMYTNFVYGSLITSSIRTRILDAIASHPNKSEAVSMVATDGIVFMKPHPGIENEIKRYLAEWNAAHSKPKKKDDRLGMWESEMKMNLFQWRAGIYWDDKDRRNIREGKGRLTHKGRGINRKVLGDHIGELENMFEGFSLESVRASETVSFVPEWPSFHIKTDFSVISCLEALFRKKWELSGKVTPTGMTISSDPESKRDAPYFDASRGIWRTKPYPVEREAGGHFPRSIPYNKGMSMRVIVRKHGQYDTLGRPTERGTVQSDFRETGLMGKP